MLQSRLATLQVGLACLAVLLLLRVVAVSIDAFASTSDHGFLAGADAPH